jgi:shikimate dehydrogenase
MDKTGLVGFPTEHSFSSSSALHNAAYRELGLDWSYGSYPCETVADFESLIKEAKREGSGFIGLDVTPPYKRDANRLSVGHSQDASLIGAANMLTFNAGRARAYVGVYADNTDGKGIIAALRHADAELAGEKVVICGGGPVALSTLRELVEAEVGAVAILSRKPEAVLAQALALFRKLGEMRYNSVTNNAMGGNRGQIAGWYSNMESHVRQMMPQVDLAAFDYSQAGEALDGAAVLINATPLGMQADDPSPVPTSLLRSSLTVLDASCGHDGSALIAAARAVDAVALDGLELLVEQAALTIELWANAQGQRLKAPRGAMRQAAGIQAGG